MIKLFGYDVIGILGHMGIKPIEFIKLIGSLNCQVIRSSRHSAIKLLSYQGIGLFGLFIIRLLCYEVIR